MNVPSMHALRAFEAAGRLGSFARAGEDLHLTPSAISHQVRALEEHFGRHLFERVNRTVILTPDGERLLAALSPAFQKISAICAELSPSTRQKSLSVHCTPSFASKWLSPRLPSFMAQHSNINIRISSSAEVVDLSYHNEIDVLITYGAPPKVKGITTLPLGNEEIAALCSPEFAARHPNVGPDDFEKIIRLESTFSPVRWSDWFIKNELKFSPNQNGPAFDRGSMVIAAAAQGLGLALETVCFAQAELNAGIIVRFHHNRFQSIQRELHFLCYRTRDEAASRVKFFREWILRESSVKT